MSEDQFAGWYFITLFIIVTPFIIIHFRRVNKKIVRSLNIAAKILNTQIKRGWVGLSLVVEGQYCSRKMQLVKYVLPKRNGLLILVRIYPKEISKKLKLVGSYPKPTENTWQLSNQSIDYWSNNFYHEKPDSDGLRIPDRISTEGEFIDIFDELVKAAEIAELGKPYFKE